jgi:hypothetical protein
MIASWSMSAASAEEGGQRSSAKLDVNQVASAPAELGAPVVQGKRASIDASGHWLLHEQVLCMAKYRIGEHLLSRELARRHGPI